MILAWNYYRGRMNVVAVLGTVAVSLVVMGLFLPALARRFHMAWMTLAGMLGYINSRILLFLLFYLLFMPYGVISRLFGRDPLNRRGPAKGTYWIRRKSPRQRPEQFERSF